MQWVISWFRTHEKRWLERFNDVEDEESADGLKCYALKKSHLWKALGDHSVNLFGADGCD
jgi:hypothetical protein